MLEFNFHPFPVIETERLTLRRITLTDIPFVFSVRSDAEIMKYIDKPLAKSEADVMPLFEQMETALAANLGISWILVLKETAQPVGQIGFWRIDRENHRAEVGYILSKAFFGKGLGSEALKLALTYGFTTLKFHSIEANVNPENLASNRILEKQGFVREAYFRENFYYNGKVLDTAIYSLLASDMYPE